MPSRLTAIWVWLYVLLAGCGPVLPGAREAEPRSNPLNSFVVNAGEARIAVHLASDLAADSATIQAWIQDGVRAVETYYGRFPVSNLKIRIDHAPRPGVHGGQSFGYPSPRLRLSVGHGTTAEQFRHDWMLTHEMIHLTFPGMSDQHIWAQEGLATYVEPLARHQAGQLTTDKVWTDLVDGLPHGTHELERAGLDENGSWGCTYWGGAVYWMLADIEIRKQSGNGQGLQDALKAILAAGGNNQADWPLRATLERGDRSLAMPVLIPLYDRMRLDPQNIDLAGLWQDLGIRVSEGRIRFDDTAPLAAIRKAIAG